MDVKKEFEGLSECIAKVGQDDDHQSMAELKQYVIDDEGSWALGDNFLIFIAKWLNDDQPANDRLRVTLLNVLAAAALKDDVILILHQDRRDHVLMNYAHNIDRLPQSEQEALSLFVGVLVCFKKFTKDLFTVFLIRCATFSKIVPVQSGSCTFPNGQLPIPLLRWVTSASQRKLLLRLYCLITHFSRTEAAPLFTTWPSRR